MADDKTCYFYLNGQCWRGAEPLKCCDPTWECEFYRTPLSHMAIKEKFLKIRAELTRRATKK